MVRMSPPTHFYRPRAGAQPNAAHVALAERPLAIPRARVAIVTQNVDGLHQAAGSPPDSVHEIHGTVHAFMCTQHGHPAQLTPQELADDDAPAPRCRVQGCGSYLRPKAVLFTEGLPSERTPPAARWLRGEARRRATRRLTRARAPTHARARAIPSIIALSESRMTWMFSMPRNSRRQLT